MVEHTPYLSSLISEFITFRTVSGNWNNTYTKILNRFDRYCTKNFPNAVSLSQEMVDCWCKQRETESINSCCIRIYAIVNLVEYLRVRKITEINSPIIPRYQHMTHIPHVFTQQELINFFNACDSLPSTPKHPTILLRKITVPVFFRLLYSSGIRAIEARLLSTADVDLQYGILNIQRSKGQDQHYVALHDSMTALLRQYDESVSKLIPNRNCFFPTTNDKFHKNLWVFNNFRLVWYSVNQAHTVTYDFRHNYATHNINDWVDEGFGFDEKMLCLSKSMGHRTTESTKYYYAITPGIADILDDKTNLGFESIVPEVYDEEIE